MAANSKIEWTDATWNPVRGCTRVSEGCRNCYAEIMAARFSGNGQWGEGFAAIVGADHRWTGKVELIPHQLRLPLSWKTGKRIFVNSTSDLFHEALSDAEIDKVFAVMALCPQHTFQVLTKRIERARELLPKILSAALPNVWLGTSCEDQATADARIPHLLATPAAVRFISAEPLLGPIDLIDIPSPKDRPRFPETDDISDGRSALHLVDGTRIDWVIVGGESGTDARPMHPDWARSLRDSCTAAAVPFFFKQWGEWGTDDGPSTAGHDPIWFGSARCAWLNDGEWRFAESGYAAPLDEAKSEWLYRVGKKRAGRLLDGIEHGAYPKALP